jgi:hypothetical protein
VLYHEYRTWKLTDGRKFLVEVNIIMIDLHFVCFVYILFFRENIKSYIMIIIHARNIYSFYPIFRHSVNRDRVY